MNESVRMEPVLLLEDQKESDKLPLKLMEHRFYSFDVHLKHDGLNVLPSRSTSLAKLPSFKNCDPAKVRDILTSQRGDAWNFSTSKQMGDYGTESVAMVWVAVGRMSISLQMESQASAEGVPFVTTASITVLVDADSSLPYRMTFETITVTPNAGVGLIRESRQVDLPPLAADLLMTKVRDGESGKSDQFWYDKFIRQTQKTPSESTGGSNASPHPVFQDLLTTARSKVETDISVHPSMKEITLKATQKVWREGVLTNVKIRLEFDELSEKHPKAYAEIETFSLSDTSRVLADEREVSLGDLSKDDRRKTPLLSYRLVSSKKTDWKAKVQSMMATMKQKKRSKAFFKSLLNKFAEISKAKFCA